MEEQRNAAEHEVSGEGKALSQTCDKYLYSVITASLFIKTYKPRYRYVPKGGWDIAYIPPPPPPRENFLSIPGNTGLKMPQKCLTCRADPPS
jgi:hypothetical protein